MSALYVTHEVPSSEVGLLSITGDIDLGSLDAFEDEVARLLERTDLRGAVLDLASTGFVDSAGIALILDLDRTIAGRGGRLVLARPSRAVRRVLELLKLEQLVICDELTDAVRRARPDRS